MSPPLMDLSLPLLAVLAGVATIGGCMDAIAGGGGLLTAPALMMAGLPPHEALGTNKGQAIFGSGISTATLWRANRVDKVRARWRFPLGVLGGMLGTWVLLQVSNQALKPLCMVLLVGAALLMFVRKRAHRAVSRPDLARILMAVGIGFYDGFFGPGTGVLLILGGLWLLGQAADQASAEAKVVNFGSNVGAFILFALAGKILWPVALAMAMGQLAGGWLGAHLLMRIGPEWVRRTGVAVCIGLVCKLGWDWRGATAQAQVPPSADNAPAAARTPAG